MPQKFCCGLRAHVSILAQNQEAKLLYEIFSVAEVALTVLLPKSEAEIRSDIL